MKDKLIKVWKNYETKQLAKVFETYMKSINAKKHVDYGDSKPHRYAIDGKSSGWNRVQLYYCKEPFKYCEEDLEITLRKRSGDYLIVERKSERAFEVDYSGMKHWNQPLMNEIYADHKELFDTLFAGEQ